MQSEGEHKAKPVGADDPEHRDAAFGYPPTVDRTASRNATPQTISADRMAGFSNLTTVLAHASGELIVSV